MAEKDIGKQFKQELEEAKFYIGKEEYDQALDLLGNMVSGYEDVAKHLSGEACEYYCFDEPMQEMLYLQLNRPDKEIRRSEIDFKALYYLYGAVLVELKSVDDARTALEKAKRWNPASTTVAFEYGETFKMNGELEQFAKVTREIYPYIFTKKDLARFYRNLGYYYIEKEDYLAGESCMIYSGVFERHPMIPSELHYIEEKNGKIQEPTLEEVKECFEANSIPLLVSEEVLNLAFSSGKHFFEAGNMEAAYYFWSIFSEFISNQSIEEILKKISKEKEQD